MCDVYHETGMNRLESILSVNALRGLSSPRAAKYGTHVVPSCSTSGALFPVSSMVEMRFQASPQSRTSTWVGIPVFFVNFSSSCSSFSCGDAPFGIIHIVRGFAAKMAENANSRAVVMSLTAKFMYLSVFFVKLHKKSKKITFLFVNKTKLAPQRTPLEHGQASGGNFF